MVAFTFSGTHTHVGRRDVISPGLYFILYEVENTKEMSIA